MLVIDIVLGYVLTHKNYSPNKIGNTIFDFDVEEGDIWRMCQTKDAPIRDWVQLAVSRAKATGNPTVFWLNPERFFFFLLFLLFLFLSFSFLFFLFLY